MVSNTGNKAASVVREDHGCRRVSGAKQKLMISIAAAIFVVAAIGWFLLFYMRWHAGNQPSVFPVAFKHQIKGFTFYYLKPTFSTDFVLQPDTVGYQSGVIVFRMKNPAGKTLVFSEEATPAGYDPSTLKTTKQFNTEYGQAVVTDDRERTTGALFAQDRTWVIINAPQPIGTDLMQQILGALTPQ
jgi:hypothetical protein